MSEKFMTKLTNEGLDMINQSYSSGGQVKLTECVASNTSYSEAQLANLSYSQISQNANLLQHGKVTQIKTDKQTVSLELLFDGHDVKDDYALNTIFVYGQLNADKRLFLVLKANQPQYINAYTGRGATNLQVNVGINLTNADQTVAVTVDGAALATQKDFEELKKTVNGKVDNEIIRAKSTDQEMQQAFDKFKEGTTANVSQRLDQAKQSLDAEIQRATNKENDLENEIADKDRLAAERFSSFDQKILSNREALDELQIGGRNLLIGTSDEATTSTGSGWDEEYGYTEVANHIEENPMRLPAKQGDTFTISADILSAEKDIVFEVRFYDKNRSYISKKSPILTAGRLNGWTFTVGDYSDRGMYPIKNISVVFSPKIYQDSTYSFSYRKLKLERGNKATDWSPAPEDVEGKINGVQNNLTSYKAEVSNIYAKASSVYTKSDVDGIAKSVKEQSADEIRKEISKVTIGGTNLIKNSGNPQNTDDWIINGANPNHKLTTMFHPFWKNKQERIFALSNQNSSETRMTSSDFKVERNTEYTLSYWAFASSTVINSDTFFIGRDNEKSRDYTVSRTLVARRKYSYSGAEYVSITFNSGESNEGHIAFDNNGSITDGKDAVLFIANIQLERGNKATDWSPAPEDVEGKIADLQQQVTDLQKKLQDLSAK